MPQILSCIQAYKVMLHFLDTIYFATYDEFLGDVLSEAALYSEDLGQKPRTMDPAIFGEWMDGLKLIMHDDTITYDVIKLTAQQSYDAARQYLIIYCNMGAEPSIQKIRDLLSRDIEQCDVTKWLQMKWLESVALILQEPSRGKIEHLLGETTGLTNRESFAVMKIFLDAYCQKHKNEDLIKLVQDSRLKDPHSYWSPVSNIIDSHIWETWQQAVIMTMQQENKGSLNLLIAFQSIPLFFIGYFNENKIEAFKDIIIKCRVDRDGKPMNFSFWCAWTSAAVKLNAEQTEIVNNLVSINTAISQDTAFKIIQTWFAKYDNFLDTKFMATVSTDTILWQQAVHMIKQSPRSYLLLDDEITVLEAYHIMVKLLELVGQNIDEFAIDPEQKNKPKDFKILLEWIMVYEQIIKKH